MPLTGTWIFHSAGMMKNHFVTFPYSGWKHISLHPVQFLNSFADLSLSYWNLFFCSSWWGCLFILFRSQKRSLRENQTHFYLSAYPGVVPAAQVMAFWCFTCNKVQHVSIWANYHGFWVHKNVSCSPLACSHGYFTLCEVCAKPVLEFNKIYNKLNFLAYCCAKYWQKGFWTGQTPQEHRKDVREFNQPAQV